MSIQIKDNIYWVGKIDWELRKFHGDEYSTHRGSTYNSYLVKGERTALIDTVWRPFAEEFVDSLRDMIDLKKIDYVIANHAEIDHSGALPELMSQMPDTPVYCTANGLKSLRGHYHKDWNFKVVKTGDKLDLGGKELVFIEAPMLHWPDSMMCYLTVDNILFSNDAFGQHYASEHMFNDRVDQDELWAECMKYYANILTPFGALVVKKINEVLSFNLPVDYICTSHGVIWRKDPLQIVRKYLEWAADYMENQVTIVYDTMWDSTRKMAEHIALGVQQADDSLTIKLHSLSKSDKNDVIVDVFKSKGVIVGSPTINKGILTSVAGFIEEMRGLNFKNKKACCFGSYGWSGESVRMLNGSLKDAGFIVNGEGLKVLWNPNHEAVRECVLFGRNFVSFLNRDKKE